MAQAGNDNQKDGVVSNYPDNVHQGLYTGGTNATPLSMATSEDNDDKPTNPSYSAAFALGPNNPT